MSMEKIASCCISHELINFYFHALMNPLKKKTDALIAPDITRFFKLNLWTQDTKLVKISASTIY
jgi:hypothetical protein